MLTRGSFGRACEAVCELAAVVGEDGLDLHRRGLLEPAQEVGAAARQGCCHMGQHPCRSTAGLKPALEGGKRDVQLLSNALLRALAACANFAQRLFPEFLSVWCSFHICRSGADHPH